MTARRRRPLLRGALALLLPGLLVACTGGGTPPAGPSAATSAWTPSPTPSPDGPPRWPLTGRPLTDTAAAAHVAVAVKISDVREAHPQQSLDAADLVFVEPNGVAYTRLAAVFHSRLPETTGPVRSIRPADVPLLSPLNAAFGNTMAADWVTKYVDRFPHMHNLGTTRVKGSDAYFIDPHRVFRADGERHYDHAVFARPRVLATLSGLTAAPAPYFRYARTAQAATASVAGSAATRLVIPYGAHPTDFTMSYRYDAASGRYQRSNPWGRHILADGRQVATDNVLVIRCRWRMGKIHPGGGADVPVLDLIDGAGTFWAASGGKAVAGTWTKGAVDDPFGFTTTAGAPLDLAPGTTWVELPQADAAVRVEP